MFPGVFSFFYSGEMLIFLFFTASPRLQFPGIFIFNAILQPKRPTAHPEGFRAMSVCLIYSLKAKKAVEGTKRE